MGVFKINPAATVVVCIERPTDTDGTAVLEVKCKYLTREERAAWLARFEAEPVPHLLLEMALGWNVTTDEGEPVPLDLEHLLRVLANFEGLDAEWVQAYVQACAKARAKN